MSIPSSFDTVTSRRSLGQIRIWVVPAVVVIVVGLMALFEPRFFSRLNLVNVLRNFSLASIVAIGQMFVIMVGGFDMAIGASAVFASIASSMVMVHLASVVGLSEGAAIAVGVMVGLAGSLAVGLLNGLFVVRFRFSPFMATLAAATAIVGGVLYVTNGVPIYGVPQTLVTAIGRGQFLGLPLICWIAACFVGICWWMLDFTAAGQHIRAVGGNEKAATAAGISVVRVKLLAYSISSVSGGLVGLLLTARIGSGDSSFGATTAIESIAAAVLGGTLLGGGVGKISRVLPASLLLAISANAMNLIRIDSKWQACALGIILIVAVLFDKE
ncbi:ABC transporter permease [Pseudaminobacter salicylatoxidans]|uniref:ABC transporter permease n=1 Tax=Pseudaminobacter salicylatoxidans TaxID=93369 RepID=UPI0002DD6B40|nr:ABC transporter permease [Pseudaminobacter salicylatoxidans]